MSIALVVGGRHSAGAIVRRLRRQVRDLEADNRQLIERAEASDGYVHEARIRACKDAMVIAQLRADRAELSAAVDRMDEQHSKTVRDMERHIAELTRCLELRSKTEAVVTKTQPIPVFIAGTKAASTNPGHLHGQGVA